MTPPPPPPPPPQPTVVAPPPVASSPASPVSSSPSAGTPPKTGTGLATVIAPDHNDQLMAAIRNGISLKPTKTNDRSTAGFIKRANGALNENGNADAHDESKSQDKPCTIDDMKDALQAELRNTLKRKIKQPILENDDDCSKKDEIERSIEHTRNEVQLKLNDPATTGAPKVNNPLKSLVDIVDKERRVEGSGPTASSTVASTAAKQLSPVPAQKTVPANGKVGSTVVKQLSPVPAQKALPTKGVTPTATVNALPKVTVQPLVNGTATPKKISVEQRPAEGGNSGVINVSPTPWKSTSPSSTKISATKNDSASNATSARNGNKSPINYAPTSVTVTKSPVLAGKILNGSPGSPSPASPKGQATSISPKINTSQTQAAASPVATASSSEKVPNGSILPGAVQTERNGSVTKTANTTTVVSKSPLFAGSTGSGPVAKAASYYNTLPRTFGSSPRVNGGNASKTAAPTAPVPQQVFSSTVNISVGAFGQGSNAKSSPGGSGGGPVVRNGIPAKIEPLTIDIAAHGNGGSSTNGTSSPSTPKELLSPQVRSGEASIRPSQIRTLKKAGSVVSHTDIVETPKPIVKLPVSLIEPVPVLTAAAAASPPPASPRVAAAPAAPAKERTPLFEKASSAKEPPKSPLNRWVDSTSVSGGTARKLLLSHGRPNFTIKRSNSRQGFDVDVPDSKSDTVKPVFRILTDLEKMESEQEQRDHADSRPAGGQQQSQPQQYVSFAKDLANAPNNHPDVAVVTKTVIKPIEPTDPFLATLKDIKIDIGEMKVVNAKET